MRVWSREDDPAERRQYERVAIPVVHCRITIETADGARQCAPQVMDLSAGGLRFRDRTDGRPLQSGVKVRVELGLQAAKHALQLDGVVVWTNAVDEKTYDGGVRFDEPSEAVGDAIKRHIERA